MKKFMLAALVMATLLCACVVVPEGRRGYHGPEGGEAVPYLPSTVILDADPYYNYNGFYYHYDRGNWFYSRSRRGPWADLPRDHYPRELRFRGKEERREMEHRHEGGEHDERDYDDWRRRDD